MADWAAFAGFAGVVLGLLLLLAHASQALFSEQSTDGRQLFRTTSDSDDSAASFDPERPLKRADTTADGGVESSAVDAAATKRETIEGWEAVDVDTRLEPRDGTDQMDWMRTDRADRMGGESAERRADPELSTTSLLVNVALSQGLFGVLLVVGAWYTEIPPTALGISAEALGFVPLSLGVGLGVALYLANEAGAALGEHVGIANSEELRRALAPDSAAGWAVLLLVVLPLIAGFEELLFRAALVGALSTGFGVSPWLLAALSSVAFALGHGAQGPSGILVTGLLGFVLAAAFVLTGSLLVVVVAHYLVNALEFVVHEGFGIDWV